MEESNVIKHMGLSSSKDYPDMNRKIKKLDLEKGLKPGFQIYCDSMDCSMPDFPVVHHLPELAHTHVH